MYRGKRISVVIPCHNEEEGIRSVLAQMPPIVDEVVVDLPLHRTEDLKRTERFRELEQVVLYKIRAQVKGGNVRITT